MGVVGKIFSAVLAIGVVVFAPYLAPLVGQFLGLSGFLATVVGGVLIAAGLTFIQSIFAPSSRGNSIDSSKVNTRVGEGIRWICAGRVRQGGQVVFAEHDSAGNFWIVVVHCDSILTSTVGYFLDDEIITVNGSGVVQNADFRLQDNEDRDPVETDGDGDGYFQIWTRTHTESNPVPGRVTEFDAAFPAWTSDHKLVGTTYSVMKITAVDLEHRYKVYKWRGPMGLGEPSISIVGQWSNVYDPRSAAGQTLGNRSTYAPSNNAELIWAWFRTHPYGRNKAESEIDWDNVALEADICDEQVSGLDGFSVRYECGIAVPENKARAIAEQEIMLSMDGQLVFNDEGKVFCRAGKYYTPTLNLTRNRDIVAMESVEAQNGESETDGVVVRYIDPDSNYVAQPAAAWLNDTYYVSGTNPRLLTIDILTCQNHNQAMRLAKAIGKRSQPTHKILPTTTLRGLQARSERFINLDYDNTFAGDYEIATPVELDEAGVFSAMGLVPVDSNRWDLLPGEESAKPNSTNSDGSVTFNSVTANSIAINEVNDLIIDFPIIARDDAVYVAQAIRTSDISGGVQDPGYAWFDLNIHEDYAQGRTLELGTQYTVRYRYLTGSGRGPGWTYETITPSVVVLPMTNFTATDGTGEVILSARVPNDIGFDHANIFRNTSDDFAGSSDISGDLTGGLGATIDYTDTVAAGTYYYWIVASDSLGNTSTVVGSVTGISS